MSPPEHCFPVNGLAPTLPTVHITPNISYPLFSQNKPNPATPQATKNPPLQIHPRLSLKNHKHTGLGPSPQQKNSPTNEASPAVPPSTQVSTRYATTRRRCTAPSWAGSARAAASPTSCAAAPTPRPRACRRPGPLPRRPRRRTSSRPRPPPLLPLPPPLPPLPPLLPRRPRPRAPAPEFQRAPPLWRSADGPGCRRRRRPRRSALTAINAGRPWSSLIFTPERRPGHACSSPILSVALPRSRPRCRGWVHAAGFPCVLLPARWRLIGTRLARRCERPSRIVVGWELACGWCEARMIFGGGEEEKWGGGWMGWLALWLVRSIRQGALCIQNIAFRVLQLWKASSWKDLFHFLIG